MEKEKSLCDIDFDFITYYESLKSIAGMKTKFKLTVMSKLGVSKHAFEKWVVRKEMPSGSIQVEMIDLINHPDNNLPKYK